MILIVVVISVAFFFLFGFANPKKDDARFECTFLVLLVLRFCVPDPFIFHFESIFLVTKIFLFLFDRETLQKKKGVFFGLIVIFFFIFICGSTGVIQTQEIFWWRVLLLGIALAGTIHFVYLTKAEDNQYLGFSVYILASVLFLFTLREEEQAYTFQFEILFYFLLLNIIFIVLFFLITEIKEEKLASIVKTLTLHLYPGYLGVSYLICSHFHPDLHSERWIQAIIIQIAILFPLQYILETKVGKKPT